MSLNGKARGWRDVGMTGMETAGTNLASAWRAARRKSSESLSSIKTSTSRRSIGSKKVRDNDHSQGEGGLRLTHIVQPG